MYSVAFIIIRVAPAGRTLLLYFVFQINKQTNKQTNHHYERERAALRGRTSVMVFVADVTRQLHQQRVELADRGRVEVVARQRPRRHALQLRLVDFARHPDDEHRDAVALRQRRLVDRQVLVDRRLAVRDDDRHVPHRRSVAGAAAEDGRPHRVQPAVRVRVAAVKVEHCGVERPAQLRQRRG